MYRTLNINKRSFPVIPCTETPATSILGVMNSYKRLENRRRQYGAEKKTWAASRLGQNEDQIANLCPLCNVLDSRMHAVRYEAVTLSGISCAPHKERGIAQGPSRFLRSECLRNVPAQCTEARLWLNTNCKTHWSGGDYVTKVYRREDVPENTLMTVPEGLPSQTLTFTCTRTEVASGVRDGRYNVTEFQEPM